MNRSAHLLYLASLFFFTRDIPLITKLFFPGRYFFDLFLIKVQKSEVKKIHFLNNKSFYYTGSHTNLVLDHILEHLRSYYRFYEKAQVVLDVGASFGTFALLTNYFNPKSQIYAFEPSKESFNLLAKNCREIENIRLVNQAVGERSSKVFFKFEKDYPEGSRVAKSFEGAYEVSQVSLDEFIENEKIKEVSLLKIDTEGYEMEVLKGASQTLALTDCVILEVENEMKNLTELLEFMQDRNFKLVDFGALNFNYQLGQIGSLDLIFRKGQKA